MHPAEESRDSQSKQFRPMPWAIGFAIVLIVTTGCINWIFFRAPTEAGKDALEIARDGKNLGIESLRDLKNLAKEIAGDIKDGLKLDAQITIEKTIFIEGNRDITELALQEKTFTYTYYWHHRWPPEPWPGPEKEIELKGTFRGKVGYDLTGKWIEPENPWGIDISKDGRVISVHLPVPTILSVEMTNYEVVKDNGVPWNRISKEDRERALNALLRGARADLKKTGILDEVDEAFFEQIEEAARKSAPPDFEVIRNSLP